MKWKNIFFVCLFVCLFVWLFWFFVLLQNFSLIWRRHHDWWRAANSGLWSAPMAIEQRGFFNVLLLLWHGHPFITVISEDPWHTHLLPRVWHRSCHYLFYMYDLGLSLGFEHSTIRLRGERSNPLSYCKFWINWVGVKTQFTMCHIVNFEFTPTQ